MTLHEDGYIDLYFGDESHFGLNLNVPYVWQHKDNPILLSSKRVQRLSVFGLMTSGCELFYRMIEGVTNSADVIAALDEFAHIIPKKTVVILDNAPVHRSKVFKKKIKEWEELDLYIYFLPPYSPELNKVEILWRFIKYKWLPYDAFLNFKNLKERLNKVLQEFGTKYVINFN